jgi:osmotically inducible protein OsmC
MQPKSQAIWEGSLKEGKGRMMLGSGAFEGKYSFGSRFEEEPGTNPEELIAAAHAGCFTMFLSSLLTDAGFTPRKITTTAKVNLAAGPEISKIELETEADVPESR